MSTRRVDDHISVDFIDPLFAVALGLNFEELGKEPWFCHIGAALGAPDTRFIVATILLGYATVILSWVGYHLSVKRNPIRLSELSGWGRFILDVILLIVYFLLLVRYHDFGSEICLLAWIYLIFIVWDVLKMLEHPRAGYESDETPGAVPSHSEGSLFFGFWYSLGSRLFTGFTRHGTDSHTRIGSFGQVPRYPPCYTGFTR